MANQRVVNYVKTQLARGFTKDQIKQALLSQKWDESEIDSAMQIVPDNPAFTPSKSSNESAGGSEKTGVPGLVKVISILFYIEGSLAVLGSAAGILAYFFMRNLLNLLPAGSTGINSTMIIVSGAMAIALGVFYFFIGRSLWKGKNWARIVTIILSGISLAGSIPGIMFGYYIMPSSVFYGTTNIIISGAIIGYFALSKKVKESFL